MIRPAPGDAQHTRCREAATGVPAFPCRTHSRMPSAASLQRHYPPMPPSPVHIVPVSARVVDGMGGTVVQAAGSGAMCALLHLPLSAIAPAELWDRFSSWRDATPHARFVDASPLGGAGRLPPRSLGFFLFLDACATTADSTVPCAAGARCGVRTRPLIPSPTEAPSRRMQHAFWPGYRGPDWRVRRVCGCRYSYLQA